MEVRVYADDYNRTIASGFSQMMGLYPADTGYVLWDNQSAFAAPPIHVDNIEAIRAEIGNSAVKDGFVPVPIHSNGGVTFDMLFAGNHPEVCPYFEHYIKDYITTDKDYLAKLKQF